MLRRRFLKLLTFGCGLLAAPFLTLRRISGYGSRTLSFYVAGVRFHRMIDHLKALDRVKLRSEVFGKENCYGIYTEYGHRIGYVPRNLVPVFNDFSVHDAYLCSIRPHTVPWKRYKITVLIKSKA